MNVREPGKPRKKCCFHYVSIVATAKAFAIMPIDDAQCSVLEITETMKKVDDGLSAQIVLNNDSVKTRGLS